jgi:hypothetical protein
VGREGRIPTPITTESTGGSPTADTACLMAANEIGQATE